MKKYFQPNKGFVKKGIAILLFIVGIVALFSFRAIQTSRWGMSECLLWQASSLSERFYLENDQYRQINVLIRDFAGAIESGAVSPGKGFAILRSFYAGPIFWGLLNASIENQIHEFKQKSEEGFENFAGVSRLFFMGLQSGKISRTCWEKIRSLLMEERFVKTVGENGTVLPETIDTFKKEIERETLISCLVLMQRFNQQAGLILTNERIDPEIELKKVLVEAIKK